MGQWIGLCTSPGIRYQSHFLYPSMLQPFHRKAPIFWENINNKKQIMNNNNTWGSSCGVCFPPLAQSFCIGFKMLILEVFLRIPIYCHTSHSPSFSLLQTHLIHTSTLIYHDSLISLVFWSENYMGSAMKYYFEWFQLSLSSSVPLPFSCYFQVLTFSYLVLILLLDIMFTHFQASIGYLAIVSAPFSDINYNNCWIQICLWQDCGAKRQLCKLLHEVIISIAKAVTVWGLTFGHYTFFKILISTELFEHIIDQNKSVSIQIYK